MTTENDSAFNYDPAENYDEATIMQQREIETKIIETQPLIGNQEDLAILLTEFASDEIYQEKVKHLQKRYGHMRRTRGDGNCFYRAFGFAYLEQLCSDAEELSRFHAFIEKSKDDLVALGFPQFTIEDFHDVLLQLLNKLQTGCSKDNLIGDFNDQSLSDYIVVYLRLLVSGQLQKEADFYACFVEGDRTVKEFCQQEVEPMGRESDHIHISILSKVCGVPVRIEYLDRSVGSSQSAGSHVAVNHHDFPEDSTPKIYLLYRPGHYDILYS